MHPRNARETECTNHGDPKTGGLFRRVNYCSLALFEEDIMNEHAWIESFPGAITVCDPDGIIMEMNSKAGETFEKDGGMALIGRNLIDCHPEPARSKLIALFTERRLNAYSIEKNGGKKLIYQAPWYHKDGTYGGIVELSLEIPFEMPHFIRGS